MNIHCFNHFIFLSMQINLIDDIKIIDLYLMNETEI